MSRQITIRPSGHVFQAQEGETILEAALREGYMLPYGCRNGACGSCKGKVIEGTVDHGNSQDSVLPGAERQRGGALFCQARPQSDLLIECREIGAVKDIMVKTLPCRVQMLERVAPDVMRIRLKLPAAERLQFLAGQYIDILLKDGTRRSLSMANPPHDDGMLELHLRNYGGPFSTHVFTQMKEKDILRFEGPRAASICARTAANRWCWSRAAPVSRRSRRSLNMPFTTNSNGRWFCTAARAGQPIFI
jgi:CDP-4-dehydro-6-deoxyglucose reductase